MASKIAFAVKDIKDIVELHKKGYSPRKIAPLYNVEYKTIYRILKRENRYINRSKDAFVRKYNCDNNYFNCIETEHKAYWLGLIAADGYVSTDKRNLLSLTLHQDDSGILSSFLKDLNSDYPIIYNKRDKCCRVDINSKQIVTNLALYNIVPRKTFKFQFPNELDNELYNHFIRGYFDGDGCVYISKTKQIEYTVTSNEHFLEQLQDILIRQCNLNKTIFKKYKRTDIKTMVYCGNKQSKRIYDYMYKNATIYFPRKKEKFDSVLSNK